MGGIIVERIRDEGELGVAFGIRRSVFVEEQGVDSLEEYDEFEEVSVHFLAWVSGTAVGTARWRKTSEGYKLERFAVLKAFRGIGVGSALVKEVLKDLPRGASPVYLNAQLGAIKLYEQFGFRTEGEEFLEAGIRHYRMRLSGQYLDQEQNQNQDNKQSQDNNQDHDR